MAAATSIVTPGNGKDIVNRVSYTHVPGTANTAATFTIVAPGAGKRNVLKKLRWSIEGPAGETTLTVTTGSYSETYYIAEPGPDDLDVGLCAAYNTTIVVTLAAKQGAMGSVAADGHVWQL